MSNKKFWDRRFRRNIVFDGLIAIHDGELEDWARDYSTRDELYVPGELRYVDCFRSYVLACVDHRYLFLDPRTHKKWAIRFFREFEKE